jgi:cytochrome c553
MLHGTGPVQGGSFVFSYPAPDAVGIDIVAGEVETPTSHTAYLSGMSAWCGNCHGPDYHNQGTTTFEHPAGRPVSGKFANRYAIYAGDDNPTGGDPATSYLPEIPFENLSMTTNSTFGPAGSDHFSCLTCHRAHASSAPAAGRWDFNVAALDNDGVVSGSYALPNPYPGPGQGPLCAKCHAPDPPGPEPPTPIGP